MKSVKSVEATAKATGGCTGKGFVKGQSGNPGGKTAGLIAAATLIQRECARLAKRIHPDAAAISQRMGFKVRTMLEVALLEMMEKDPRSFLAFFGGKPRETVDLITDSLPPVVHVRFGNFDPDAPRPDTVD